MLLLLVGLRKWNVRRALAKLPDSGGTYVQLEKVTTTFNGTITGFTSGGKASNFVGSQLRYGDKCRIKHIISQQYFSIRSTDSKHEVINSIIWFGNNSNLLDHTTREK